MNISSQIFYNDGSNSSNHFSFNGTGMETESKKSSLVVIMIALLGFPANSYVIWLIVLGTGNGVAAEFFNLNLAVCEIFISMYSIIDLFRFLTKELWVLTCVLEGLAMAGRLMFQCLICVERFLAVVHPVTFLKYKPLRYRLICCGIVWVSGFSMSGISIISAYFNRLDLYFVAFLVLFLLFFSIQLFCSVAVLRTLKQSGPGERKREKEEENLMKRRAFNIILISTVTIVIIYIPYVIVVHVVLSSSDARYLLLAFGYVLFTSAGLVQPLLFLSRVKKLPFVNYQ